MKIIGLTGPSGAGKGFSYHFFKKLDIPCIDTDDVYHKLLIPPSACVDELAKNFGTEILQKNGTVDRKRLANIVFSDESHKKLELLNLITHKYVLDKAREIIKAADGRGERAIIVDAPALYESGFDRECDFVICLLADPSLRLTRIIDRDSISEERAGARINGQKSDDFYSSRADHTILNNNSPEQLRVSLENILSDRGLI